ncbi:hypothetical protein ACHAPX_004906 [Trichoderma viride]
MADVRALLRQQRAARRITHPLATYSDAGKLLCTLCRDQIRAEAHWDAHLLSEKHKKLLAAAPNGEEEDDHDEAEDEAEAEDDARAADDAMSTTSQKRKHDDLGTDDEDLDMDHDQDERRKRNKPEASENLSRKKSTMPSQGVEVQIPSRASTPIHHREHSSSSSVHSQPTNAPAAAITTPTAMTTSLPSRQASNLATPASSSSMMSVQYTNPQPTTTTTTAPTTTAAQAQVNEDEWAAFEADIAATTATETTYDDATISRPAMTAQESALAKESAAETEAQNPESRKSKADADIEDEREEATRALEDEFEEMQELEARVQRLKEKREAFLRTRRESRVEPADIDIPGSQEANVKPTPGVADDEAKENVKAAEDMDDTEAEDDEDDEDDWDGFRFRTGR